jgi:hypothetical protein
MVDISTIAKLELEPGDILLVSVPANTTYDQMSHISETLQAVLDQANKKAITTFISTDDIKYEIVRRKADAG